jgi:hypothetical protein
MPPLTAAQIATITDHSGTALIETAFDHPPVTNYVHSYTDRVVIIRPTTHLMNLIQVNESGTIEFAHPAGQGEVLVCTHSERFRNQFEEIIHELPGFANWTIAYR